MATNDMDRLHAAVSRLRAVIEERPPVDLDTLKERRDGERLAYDNVLDEIAYLTDGRLDDRAWRGLVGISRL